MKQIIFRSLAVLLGAGALFVALFTTQPESESAWMIVRNVFFGCLLLAYGLGGPKLLSSIPVLAGFVKEKDAPDT